MEDKELHQLHQALLLITDEVDRLCRRNHIRYSLIGGSMLGAVRHKGFIPWDDDMDIGMLRSEYERFLEVCRTQLGESFDLQTNATDEHYVYGFAKILLKDTYLVQYGHEKTKHRKGIFVDIFPFDPIPDDSRQRTRQKRKNYLLIKMLDRKFTRKSVRGLSFKKQAVFKTLDFMNLFVSQRTLVRKLNDNMQKYQSGAYVSNMSGYYGYDKETVPKKFMEEQIEVPFEDRRYWISKEYDSFLTLYYGDYMVLPPVEQRRTHGFQQLDFGSYGEKK